jgi:hypothetical protein
MSLFGKMTRLEPPALAVAGSRAIDVRRERASSPHPPAHPLPPAGEGRAGAQRRVPRDNFPSPKIIATGSLPLLALAEQQEQQRCSPKADRGPLRRGMYRCGH